MTQDARTGYAPLGSEYVEYIIFQEAKIRGHIRIEEGWFDQTVRITTGRRRGRCMVLTNELLRDAYPNILAMQIRRWVTGGRYMEPQNGRLTNLYVDEEGNVIELPDGVNHPDEMMPEPSPDDMMEQMEVPPPHDEEWRPEPDRDIDYMREYEQRAEEARRHLEMANLRNGWTNQADTHTFHAWGNPVSPFTLSTANHTDVILSLIKVLHKRLIISDKEFEAIKEARTKGLSTLVQVLDRISEGGIE